MSKLDDFGLIFSSKSPVFGVCFGPGPEPLQTRVRVRELDPGTRVSDPGLDALVIVLFSKTVVFTEFLFKQHKKIFRKNNNFTANFVNFSEAF